MAIAVDEFIAACFKAVYRNTDILNLHFLEHCDKYKAGYSQRLLYMKNDVEIQIQIHVI